MAIANYNPSIMKKIGFAVPAFLCLASLNLFAQSPSSSRNYVMETLVRTAGKKSAASLVGLPVDSANRTVSYYDGLGRPMQQVQWQGSAGRKDVVGFSVYDALGREPVRYLPYADGGTADGSFRTSPVTAQSAFYSAPAFGIPSPYSVTVFEPSPLNRVLEQGAPGSPWQPYAAGIPGSGHTVKTEHGLSGNDALKIWTVGSSGATVTGTYGANTLYKVRTEDENGNSS